MTNDPFDLEGQEKAKKDADDKAKLEARIEKEDLVWLMQTKRGRRVVHRIVAQAGVFQLSFNTNAMTMAFNEGRRNEGLALTGKLLEACPDQYLLMLKEQ